MAIIKARNTLHEGAAFTRLTHNEASGVTALRWENPNGFSASWGIQIGETGQEQTEVRVLGASTPAGTAGTVTAATDYEHPADTPIYGIKYDQVVFQKSATGTTGAAASITNGTITYQADGDVTQFDDTSGVSTDAYRTLFRSSGLSSNSTQSDWITFAGLSFYSLGGIRQRAKDKLWDPTFIREDSVWDNWINEWKDEMTNEVIQTNEDYTLGTEDVVIGTSGIGTVTAADFSQVRRLWMNYNGTETFQSTKMNINDMVPNQIFSGNQPHHAWRGDTVFQMFPDGAGTASLVYYQFGTTMVNDTDTLPQPMRSYTKSFVDYCVAQALYKDQKNTEADTKMSEALNAKRNFLQNLAPRDKTGPTYIDIVENMSGDDGFAP